MHYSKSHYNLYDKSLEYIDDDEYSSVGQINEEMYSQRSFEKRKNIHILSKSIRIST
jgi:tRNA 2-selenouridine synthase SelU